MYASHPIYPHLVRTASVVGTMLLLHFHALKHFAISLFGHFSLRPDFGDAEAVQPPFVSD